MHEIAEAYKHTWKRMRTWPFWRSMIVLFCVCSLIGHLIEWPYCAFGAFFFNSVSWDAEVLANPLKPFFIYGVGIVMCAILLAPLKDGMKRCEVKTWQAVLAFYVLAVFLGMAMELIQGFLQNQPDEFGNYPLWDVSDYPGNILGQAWIVNDLLLGAVFTFATWHIYPQCEKRMGQLDELGDKAANRNLVIIVAVFAVLVIVTYFIV